MISDKAKRGIEKTPHRSLFKAMGYTDFELERPLIGIANSANEIVPGHIHLDKITDAVKAGVRMAGGTPIAFGVIGVCDGIAMNHEGMKYSLVSREVIADSVEIMAKAHAFDGLVLVTNCDKVTPGMLMAAARLNIPAIMVSGGPMLTGLQRDVELDLISLFNAIPRAVADEIAPDEWKIMEDCACPGAGSCAGMFTANTMNCLTEALGMALPGNGTIPAVYGARIRLAKETGMAVMNLVKQSLTPRQIMGEDAFRNAIVVDMALGGSTNTVLHLPAIAREAGHKLDLRQFNEVSASTPHLCNMSPGGNHHLQDLYFAGGIQALTKVLLDGGHVHGDAITVAGKKMTDAVSGAKVLNEEVIRPLSRPYHKTGGLAILFGNLAPEGAVVKESAVAEEMLRHEGPAHVFDSEGSAAEAIIHKQVREGEVIVIRYEGPKGGPGMQEMLTPTAAITGIGMDRKVALITDGRFSGGTKGAAIGHVSPEGIEGGPIALLRDGDVIQIDIPGRKLNVKLTEAELDARRAEWKPPAPKIQDGCLGRYARMVSSGSKGAVLP